MVADNHSSQCVLGLAMRIRKKVAAGKKAATFLIKNYLEICLINIYFANNL